MGPPAEEDIYQARFDNWIRSIGGSIWRKTGRFAGSRLDRSDETGETMRFGPSG
jgi:hypothetical protein